MHPDEVWLLMRPDSYYLQSFCLSKGDKEKLLTAQHQARLAFFQTHFEQGRQFLDAVMNPNEAPRKAKFEALQKERPVAFSNTYWFPNAMLHPDEAIRGEVVSEIMKHVFEDTAEKERKNEERKKHLKMIIETQGKELQAPNAREASWAMGFERTLESHKSDKKMLIQLDEEASIAGPQGGGLKGVLDRLIAKILYPQFVPQFAPSSSDRDPEVNPIEAEQKS